MSSGDLVARVEVLEKKMTALEELPARVSSLETRIVQLRTEMKGEFSAVRQEMRSLKEETRVEMRSLEEELRAEIALLHLAEIEVAAREVAQGDVDGDQRGADPQREEPGFVGGSQRWVAQG